MARRAGAVQPAVMDILKLEQPGPAGAIGHSAVNGGLLLTQDEYDSYLEELVRLREIRDHDLPDLMREARTFVASDAVEELIQVQDDHAVVAARIGRLEELLRTARLVDDDLGAQVVTLGRSVEVEYVRTGKVTTYRIAGVAPSSGSGAVSAASPIGSALMGRSPGDLVAVELPRGRVEDLRILSVAQP